MIGELVKRLRKERKLSQAALAKAIRVTQQDISGLERGFVDQPRYIQDLAKYFGMSLDQFYWEAGMISSQTPEDERSKHMKTISEKAKSLSLERLRLFAEMMSSTLYSAPCAPTKQRHYLQ